jgi:hypothetical protein
MDGMTEPRKTMKIGAAALGGLQASPDARSAPFEAPKLPPGVIPKGAAVAIPMPMPTRALWTASASASGSSATPCSPS